MPTNGDAFLSTLTINEHRDPFDFAGWVGCRDQPFFRYDPSNRNRYSKGEIIR